jgi:uncharacterized protein
MLVNHSVLESVVYHQRHAPKKHSFVHKVLFLLVDIEEAAKGKTKLFSFNKFNVFSISVKDYDMGGVRKKLAENNISGVEKIFLLTMPKFFGYAFNPVSFFLCFNQAQQLICVLVEVHNTFKERHTYLAHHQNFNPITNLDVIHKEKKLHVSPFCQVEGRYKFRFLINAEKIKIDIDYYVNDDKLISTSINGKVKEMREAILLKYFFLNMFAPFKVIFLIHYHALCLWCKKIPYFKKPPTPNNNIS